MQKVTIKVQAATATSSLCSHVVGHRHHEWRTGRCFALISLQMFGFQLVGQTVSAGRQETQARGDQTTNKRGEVLADRTPVDYIGAPIFGFRMFAVN